MEPIYARRVARLQASMEQARLDGYLLNAYVNTYYFSGFYEELQTRFICLIVPSAGEPVFLAPQLYAEEAAAAARRVAVWRDGGNPFAEAARVAAELGIAKGRLAIDDTMPCASLFGLKEQLPEATFLLGGEHVKALRRVKSPEELALLLEIGRITDAVMEKAIAFLRPGVCDTEVRQLLKSAFAELGAKMPGNGIVAYGAESAKPHSRAEKQVFAHGPVLMDFGGLYQGYRSDITRTVHIGQPDAGFREIYEVVKQAHMAAKAAVREGACCEALDRVARGHIEAAGYGPYFTHRLGHGIGLDMHEAPFLAAGNPQPVRAGEVFSIEPGIYLPGRYGVRIEDCVAATASGCLPLTTANHELIVID